MSKDTTVKRAACYARFSTDKQNERSTEDQAALCRVYAEKHGFEFVGLYEDKAKSGASFLHREGINDMLADAKHGLFDIVLTESLDRLSRDQEDIAHIYKRMRHAGVAIVTLSEGEVNELHIGLKGTMGALYLRDLADKTKRGLSGVVRDGRHAGGRAFGYRPVPGKPGALEIVTHEAEIVREIFTLYVAGRTPRDIAKGLNARKVLPPRGKYWTSSTLNGSRARRNGILMNDLYNGVIVWNRQSFVKDPDTGKRVSRPNPQSEWQTCEAPHLRIVPKDLWEAAQARKAARGGEWPHKFRKNRYLLSGLLKCRCCGSSLTVHDTRASRVRVRCSRWYETGACTNKHSYSMHEIESLVLSGLKAEMKHPDVMVAYVKAYNDERRKLASDIIKRRSSTERRIADAKAEISRWQHMYVKGRVSDEAIDEHIPRLQNEVTSLEAELASIGKRPTLIELHPSTIESYHKHVEDLQRELTSCDPNEPGPAKTIRELIQSVVVHEPEEGQPLRIEIKGKMAAIVGVAVFPEGEVVASSNAGDKGGCGGRI